MLRTLALLVLSACAATVEDPERSPRALSLRHTGCEHVAIKDFETKDERDTWSVVCHGRTFQCERTAGADHCEVETKSASLEPDEVLLQRMYACHHDDGAACHDLAEDYEMGRHGVPADRHAAIDAYTRACDLGREADCRRGQLLQKAR